MPAIDPILTEQLLHDHLASEIFSSSGEEGNDRVGIEVEFFPLLRSRLGTPEAQPTREGDASFVGLYPWLLSVAERYGWAQESAPNSPDLAFLLPTGGRITLEPGGQVEYSSPPFDSAEEALEDVEGVEGLLRCEGERVGLMIVSEGFNRWFGGGAPELIVEKPRYLLMDRHFQKIGPFGRQMMRQTCATQINLDFGSGQTAVARWHTANMIAPALNALFANSPYTLDDIFYRSYRYQIWRRTDPSRAGYTVGEQDADPVAPYLRFALDASVIMIALSDEECCAPAGPMSFRSWMNGERANLHGYPDLHDWELHLTTLFPHVRPRGFLELRSIDGLPAPARRAAVILATSLLYNEGLRDAARALCDARRLQGEEGIRANENPTEADDWNERFALGKALLEMAVEKTGSRVLRDYLTGITARKATPEHEVVFVPKNYNHQLNPQ